MRLPPSSVEVTTFGFIIRRPGKVCSIPFGYNRLMREEVKEFGNRMQEALKAQPSKLEKFVVGKK